MIPALGMLFLVGGVTGAVAALGSKKPAPKLVPPAPSKTRSYAIGQGLPAPTLQQVLNLLQDGTPAQLDAAARELENRFPQAAIALRHRAAGIDPSWQTSASAPAPRTAPAVEPSALTPGANMSVAPNAALARPNLSLPTLDEGMTPEWHSTVWGAIATEQDPDALRGMASHIKDTYPIAASRLLERADKLSKDGAPPAWFPPLASAAPSGSAPSGAPTTSPVQLTASSASQVPAFDPGMPREIEAEVRAMLLYSEDAALLRNVASKIMKLYPTAAGALLVSAARIENAQPKAVTPEPIVATSQPTTPGASATLPVAWSVPSAAPNTTPTTAGPSRSATLPTAWPDPIAAPSMPVQAPHTASSAGEAAKRNAGRPSAHPYITLQGEATSPAQIAREATGNEMNYSQLSALNPQFVKDGVHWMNIQRGDEINIPSAWENALASRYHIADTTGLAVPSHDVPASVVPDAPSLAPVTPLRAAPPTPIETLPNAQSDDVRTYTVKAGDFPIKIAKALTGSGDRWHELVAANVKPQRADGKATKPDGNFETLLPGEVLHLPASWSAAKSAEVPVSMFGGAHAANA